MSKKRPDFIQRKVWRMFSASQQRFILSEFKKNIEAGHKQNLALTLALKDLHGKGVNKEILNKIFK